MEHVFEEIGNGKAHKWSLAIVLIVLDDHFVLRANVPASSSRRSRSRSRTTC